MSQNKVETQVAGDCTTCMESVNRIAKLPVVESTIQTATNVYEKVKDYNSITNWTLSQAENTMHKAVEIGKPIATPVIKNLEGPIKKVDGVLCSGLDYVESKVPAVKMPPGELLLQIYNSTKDMVSNTVTPVVESAKTYTESAMHRAKDVVEPAVTQARNVIEPAVTQARNVIEPAVTQAKSVIEPQIEKARTMVEPYVQPAMDQANAIKDNMIHRVDEFLHHRNGQQEEASGTTPECKDCREESSSHN